MRDVAALDMTLEIWDYDVAADDQVRTSLLVLWRLVTP